MSLPLTKQALLAEISQSRAAVIRDFRALKDGMNVTAKLRNSVRAYSPVWLGGATVLGFLFTRMFRKKKNDTLALPAEDNSIFPRALKSLKYGGTLFTVCKFVLPLLKPAISAYTKARRSH